MATRGKSIKITIESLDDCEKERSKKINIEKLKNGKLGDQHIRSATGCCWTSQISSRQVYQLVLFKWKILHRGGFQNIRKNIVAELNVGHLFEEKIPMLCLQKLFFFHVQNSFCPQTWCSFEFIFHSFDKDDVDISIFFWNSSYVGILYLNINNENFNRAFWCSLHLCAKEKQLGASGEGHIF